jgi:DNA-binding GntR family transcriptional regulator
MDDNDGPRPVTGGPAYVYAQVADDIERRIRRGEWARDERLPGRERMAEAYRVADRTIRRAMEELEARGLVEVVTDKGTFVVWPAHGSHT